MRQSISHTSEADDAAARAGAILRIDLSALAGNYRLLQGKLSPGSACGAVVKADAYGLGMTRVAPALAAAGCRVFFVALLDEAIALRAVLPDAEIHVFAGATAVTADEFTRHRLIPVLNHLGQIADFAAQANRERRRLAADIHLDTGMNRLGLPEAEVAELAANPGLIDGLDLRLVISHLACADETESPAQ